MKVVRKIFRETSSTKIQKNGSDLFTVKIAARSFNRIKECKDLMKLLVY
jgi:hypothetical protein